MNRLLLLALAFSIAYSPVAVAQTTASQVVPGQYATAPQTGCAVGPCFLPVSPTNPLPVTPVSGGVDQDVNIVAVGGNAVTTSVPVEVESGIIVADQGDAGASPWLVANTTGITPTDRTITSASGASQQIMAANSSRHSLIIQNTGNANCGINPTGGTAVIGGAGTLTLLPAGSYQPRVPTLSAVTIICTAGQPIYAEEN